MSFKEKFRQLDPGPDLEQLRHRLARVEQLIGGGGGGDSGNAINIRDYGASGGGSKDDGPAIQDAFIDAGRSDGVSKVRFPDGTYFVEDGPILIPSNVTPLGAGMGNSTIQGALNGKPTLELDNCENVRFEGLTFTKEAEPNNTDSWYFFGTGDNIRFHECEWRDLPRQGGLFRGSDYRVTECRIRNTGRDGLLFAGVNRPIVAFNHFFRTGDDSIAFNASTSNGIAAGNVIEESGYHHAGGGVKQHGNNCLIAFNVFNRPKTYAVRVQNRDEDSASEGPWPNRVSIGPNIVNGMNPRGGSKNYAIEVKTINGVVDINNNTINTYDGEGENRRGMRIRATGPTTRVHITGGSISQHPEADSKYGIVLENEFEHIEIDDVSFYNTSDGITKRNAAAPAGDCEISDCYFSPREAKRFFHCADDDGFETLRIRGNTSKSPGSDLVSLNNAKFGLVQVHDNMARKQSITTGTSQADKLVTGAL